MPSILAEISFVSNLATSAACAPRSTPEVAESLYRGIAKYRGRSQRVKVASRVERKWRSRLVHIAFKEKCAAFFLTFAAGSENLSTRTPLENKTYIAFDDHRIRHSLYSAGEAPHDD